MTFIAAGVVETLRLLTQLSRLELSHFIKCDFQRLFNSFLLNFGIFALDVLNGGQVVATLPILSWFQCLDQYGFQSRDHFRSIVS